MATVTIEISNASKEFVDQQVAAGRVKDTSALVQLALDQLMRSKWKEDAERKIGEALDEYERGEFTPWQKGDCEKRGREYLHEKRARESKS
jgi:Arc/MetJ-type ribon-helix-helix transcriptional regulator